MSTPPPGWYADPAAAHDPTLPLGALRWWDGAGWTAHTHRPEPRAAAPVAVAPVASFAPVVAHQNVGAEQVPAASVTENAQASPDTVGERNPFSTLALIFGLATIAAAGVVAVTALAWVVAVVAGLLALLFGILGAVRSVSTRTGRASSVWGIVLGPVGFVAAGVVAVVMFLAVTPNLGIPGVDYVPAASDEAEHTIRIDLETAAVTDSSVTAPDSVECPEDIRSTDTQFLCTITFVDGSANVAVVTRTSAGLMWMPAEPGDAGE